MALKNTVSHEILFLITAKTTFYLSKLLKRSVRGPFQIRSEDHLITPQCDSGRKAETEDLSRSQHDNVSESLRRGEA